MTPTIQAPSVPNYDDTPPYVRAEDGLGMRYECEDVENIKKLLTAARAQLPVMSKAMRTGDLDSFVNAFAEADLDLIRALAKAESLLAALRAT